MTTRREFVKMSGALGIGLNLLSSAARAAQVPVDKSRAPLRILILGGTGFIGPYQVRYAVQRGHEVTVFNRGRRQADLPAGVKHLQGDRNGQLDALTTGTWDCVIDNSATNPDWVRMSAGLLRDRAKLYLYVSSASVYYPFRTTDIDESVEPSLDKIKDDPASSYGVDKALSEIEAEKAFPGRALIVRPHYIVGPGDTTDRFPYWPQRVERGGDVLAPGRPTDRVELVDVRDLTEWMVRMLEEQATGRYNVAGPQSPLSMGEFLGGVRAAVSGSNPVRFVWVDDYDFLEKHGVGGVTPWVLPKGNFFGFATVNFDKALARGLTFRPLAETVGDTLAWWNSDAVASERRAKASFPMTPQKEAEVLMAWNARTTRP
ncbi:NAD-dependent epimerase/dehydratase family protein [Sphingosinicella rhizophila]|uniref:NAD-dependent epimerase/dehydratase family protein n=1 Tax=Sphingosinicella rhizophila TaxID=3050082 RepID=A0ABU3QAX6_9SPHN|nr:NAD-dependent epimerase/dehydratase family protein [Sphingosinicella sp. GR2756]MDT9600524.1 NAD-dependent epimerase/dehydratase family protein [Sphingosinicella sp. GR2756]